MVVTVHWWWETCLTVNPREERFSTALGHSLHAFIYNIATFHLWIWQGYTSTNSFTKFNVFSVCTHSCFINCKLNLYACKYLWYCTGIRMHNVGPQKNTHYTWISVTCSVASRQPHHYISPCHCNKSTVCISAAQLLVAMGHGYRYVRCHGNWTITWYQSRSHTYCTHRQGINRSVDNTALLRQKCEPIQLRSAAETLLDRGELAG